MESDNLSCEQVSSALTSAGIGNHAVRPQNGRLFPLTANSDHVSVFLYSVNRNQKNAFRTSETLVIFSRCASHPILRPFKNTVL